MVMVIREVSVTISVDTNKGSGGDTLTPQDYESAEDFADRVRDRILEMMDLQR